MPRPREVGALRPGATEAQRLAALTTCIAEQVRAGREPDEAREICERMITEQMGAPATPEVGGL